MTEALFKLPIVLLFLYFLVNECQKIEFSNFFLYLFNTENLQKRNEIFMIQIFDCMFNSYFKIIQVNIQYSYAHAFIPGASLKFVLESIEICVLVFCTVVCI